MSAACPKIFRAVQDDVTLPEGFEVRLMRDVADPAGRWFFQVRGEVVDIVTGETGWQGGRKQYLSEHMTLSELVQCVWDLYVGFVTHEARETFLYRERRVFGPHMDIEAVWSIADRFDAR